MRSPTEEGIFILRDKRKIKSERIAVYPSSHRGSGFPGYRLNFLKTKPMKNPILVRK